MKNQFKFRLIGTLVLQECCYIKFPFKINALLQYQIWVENTDIDNLQCFERSIVLQYSLRTV